MGARKFSFTKHFPWQLKGFLWFLCRDGTRKWENRNALSLLHITGFLFSAWKQYGTLSCIIKVIIALFLLLKCEQQFMCFTIFVVYKQLHFLKCASYFCLAVFHCWETCDLHLSHTNLVKWPVTCKLHITQGQDTGKSTFTGWMYLIKNPGQNNNIITKFPAQDISGIWNLRLKDQ